MLYFDTDDENNLYTVYSYGDNSYSSNETSRPIGYFIVMKNICKGIGIWLVMW